MLTAKVEMFLHLFIRISFVNLNNSQLSDIDEIPGEISKLTMRPLKADEDYSYDAKKGIIFLKNQIRNPGVLAVSYQTGGTKVGTFSEDLNDTIRWNITKLIKDKYSTPYYENLWPLVLRNAYIIPDSILNNPYFNLKIGYGPNGIYEYSQTEDPQYSYVYLLGLDRVNSLGDFMLGGDNQFDFNQNLLIPEYKVLLFPCLRPFNPSPTSIFQISEQKRAKIYHTADVQERYRYSYFKLFCYYKN